MTPEEQAERIVTVIPYGKYTCGVIARAEDGMPFQLAGPFYEKHKADECADLLRKPIAAAIRDAEVRGWEACAQQAEDNWGGYYGDKLRDQRKRVAEGD